jgi:aspartyl-tRNA(Asn)/glutamyl-tRNA(Gln) amidotransferase subunit C
MVQQFSVAAVQKIAQLANLPLQENAVGLLADAFTKTIGVVDELQKIDCDNVEPTSQVTGLENVTREDVVDQTRMFTQEEALQNAPSVYNGFFMVRAVFEEE